MVGFGAPAAGNGPVRAGDAFAWPEVLFDAWAGCRSIPLPDRTSQPRPVEEDFKPRSPRRPRRRSNQRHRHRATSDRVTPPELLPPRPALARRPGRSAGSGLGPLLLLAAGAAFAVLLLRRTLRRRRLSEGRPRRWVFGAWLEFMDALRLARHPAAAHLSASEVAAHARQVNVPSIRPAVPPIDELAGLLNHLTFGAATVDEDQARAAVSAGSGIHGEAARRATVVASPWWSLHLGPLRWHR